MIKMKDILQEQMDVAIFKKICNHWKSVPIRIRNAYTADKRNKMSSGLPLDMEQICKDPQGWNFNDADINILKSILSLPNA